jgi:hypothetical protein
MRTTLANGRLNVWKCLESHFSTRPPTVDGTLSQLLFEEVDGLKREITAHLPCGNPHNDAKEGGQHTGRDIPGQHVYEVLSRCC